MLSFFIRASSVVRLIPAAPPRLPLPHSPFRLHQDTLDLLRCAHLFLCGRTVRYPNTISLIVYLTMRAISSRPLGLTLPTAIRVAVFCNPPGAPPVPSPSSGLPPAR